MKAKEKCVPFSLFRASELLGTWLGNDAEEIYATAANIPVREIMSRNLVTVKETDSIEKVLELILRYDISRIPVVRDRKPVGIVARHDLLKVMKTTAEQLEALDASQHRRRVGAKP